MIKVKWDVEELVALIDIYRNSISSADYDEEKALKKLSKRLWIRAERLGITHDEKYRNENGMRMMYQNVVYIATDGQQGLSASSSRMKKTYSLIYTKPDVFNMILEDFNRHYR